MVSDVGYTRVRLRFGLAIQKCGDLDRRQCGAGGFCWKLHCSNSTARPAQYFPGKDDWQAIVFVVVESDPHDVGVEHISGTSFILIGWPPTF